MNIPIRQSTQSSRRTPTGVRGHGGGDGRGRFARLLGPAGQQLMLSKLDPPEAGRTVWPGRG